MLISLIPPLVILALLIIVPWIAEATLSRFDLFAAKNIFLTFIFLQFVGNTIYVILGGYNYAGSVPISFLNTRSTLAPVAMWYAILSVVAVYLGYYPFRKSGRLKILRAQKTPLSARRRLRVDFVVVALGLVGVASFVVLVVVQGGGIVSFFSGIEDFRNNHLLGTGYLFWGMNCLFVAFVVSYSIRLTTGSQTFSLPLLITSIVIGLLGAFRHMAVETIAACLALRHYGKARFKISLSLVILVTFILSLNVLYVLARTAGGDVRRALEASTNLEDVVYGNFMARFTGIESVVRVVEVTDVTGYEGGSYLARDLVFGYFPRFLWPGKPTSFSAAANIRFFKESFQSEEQTGAAVTTLVGSLYWIGGPIAIAAGMFFHGLLFAHVENLLSRKPNAFTLGIYANVYVYALFVNETFDLHLNRLILHLIMFMSTYTLCSVRPATSLPRPTVAHTAKIQEATP